MITFSRQRKWSPAAPFFLLLLLPLFICSAAPVHAETVRIPMSMDMELLRALVVDQAYREAGERARVVGGEGCNEIWLSQPQVGYEQGLLRFQTTVSIYWGTPIGGNCYVPFIWEGSLVLLQQPEIDNQWHLRFNILTSALFESSGKSVSLAGILWSLVKKHVHAYLGTIAINLAPPVDNLKGFIISQSVDDNASNTRRILAGTYPDRPLVTEKEIRIDILAETGDILFETEQEEGVVASPAAQARVMELWQSWDAMLIHLIGQLSDKPLGRADRQLLLDTMLTIRYEFNGKVAGDGLTNEFVRDQFVWAWRVLEPLFRRHLVAAPGNNLLGYLSFFTAADALAVLDRIGPLLGIEISRDGFYRLAHMLSNEPLDESGTVDPRLRRILGLDDQLMVPSAPLPLEEGMEKVPEDNGDRTLQIPSDASLLQQWIVAPLQAVARLFSFTETAHAASQPSLLELRSWTAGLKEADNLLPRVQKVLYGASQSQGRILADQGVDTEWFIRMMGATAWQESCFRQFVVKDGKIVYLLSYNNTSVGIMQINERVWRGLYDIQELRWNIRYNSMAGAEILGLYLERYILGQNTGLSFKGKGKERYLAGWLYALYNGGPSQVNKYPTRKKTDTLYRSDTLFLEKYDRVGADNWLDTVDCLPTR